MSLSAHPFRLELSSALRWGGGGELEALHHVLIRAEDDAGNVGVAEAPVRPTIYGETVASVKAATEELLAPALIGFDTSQTETLERVLARLPNNHCAKGATDWAIADLRAAAQGRTLLEAEGGGGRRLEVSFILGIAALDATLREAERIYAQGVRVFKVKVGRDAAHDARVLGALYHLFAGAGVTLYADANEGLDPETAHRDLERLAKLGVAYLEEPLPVHLIKARAELKRAQIVPIIADDSCFSPNDLERELAFDTFDILNLKPPRTGVLASSRMLNAAHAAGKGVMVGSQASSGLGTLHSAIFATRAGVTHPCELSFPLKLEGDILDHPLAFHGGFLDAGLLETVRLSPAWHPESPYKRRSG